jgi:valyl-tRNA synthetase
MQKTFTPSEWESRVYAFWEQGGYLSAQSVKDPEAKPYTVLMPPPNANASLHAGHGMYTVDDVITRWKRLNGFASEWVPGMDHAGFETQFVYEKVLRKEGKSRMDFDRSTLYNNIFAFVQENSGLIYEQFRRLGFLADWSRSTFTLDDSVIAYVYETFEKMVADGFVYRDEYIVNYCTHCGTSLADLEVTYVEQADPLYYIRYKLVDGQYEGKDYVTVATSRTELIPIDTHLAVHPDNPKTEALIGHKVYNPISRKEMEIIADEFVDPEFGTGIVKLTPAHDPNDFVAAKRHGLPIITGIDMRGKMVDGPYAGMKASAAREAALKDIQDKDLVERIDENYIHTVQTCYKCGHVLEPLTIPNWFVRVEQLKKHVQEAVENDAVMFHPKKFKRHMLDWLEAMHDWPISRQLVWGIRIPVWYRITEDSNIYVTWIDEEGQTHHGIISEFLKDGVGLNIIKEGLQSLTAHPGSEYVLSAGQPDGDMWLPETDTFDTWFSSGQWPLVTLRPEEFATRFPFDFLGTLSDILKFWVSRMIMFSLYRRNEVPFKHVYLWSMVADKKGMKMSKSKGNVLNPIDLVDTYGADALRASLFFGVSQGGKVILAEDKVRAMRNYANKIWNIGRFIQMCKEEGGGVGSPSRVMPVTEPMMSEFSGLQKKAVEDMDGFNFSRAFDDVYEFVWHRLADYYIEQLKEPMKSGNIEILEKVEKVYVECLKLAHPFMPFVTESIWQNFYGEDASILDSRINLNEEN